MISRRRAFRLEREREKKEETWNEMVSCCWSLFSRSSLLAYRRSDGICFGEGSLAVITFNVAYRCLFILCSLASIEYYAYYYLYVRDKIHSREFRRKI